MPDVRARLCALPNHTTPARSRRANSPNPAARPACRHFHSFGSHWANSPTHPAQRAGHAVPRNPVFNRARRAGGCRFSTTGAQMSPIAGRRKRRPALATRRPPAAPPAPQRPLLEQKALPYGPSMSISQIYTDFFLVFSMRWRRDLRKRLPRCARIYPYGESGPNRAPHAEYPLVHSAGRLLGSRLLLCKAAHKAAADALRHHAHPKRPPV